MDSLGRPMLGSDPRPLGSAGCLEARFAIQMSFWSSPDSAGYLGACFAIQIGFWSSPDTAGCLGAGMLFKQASEAPLVQLAAWRLVLLFK